MIEILKFIFQDFWTWAGSVILLSILVTGITSIFSSIFKRTTYNINATKANNRQETDQKGKDI
jgi:fido (protein-threonine AMPylation protein)